MKNFFIPLLSVLLIVLAGCRSRPDGVDYDQWKEALVSLDALGLGPPEGHVRHELVGYLGSRAGQATHAEQVAAHGGGGRVDVE